MEVKVDSAGQGTAVACPPTASARRRLRPFLIVLGVAMLIGLVWIVEVNTFLSHIRDYTAVQFNKLKPAEPPSKSCAHLNHRDPKFMTKENKKLCLSKEEVVSIIRDTVLMASAVLTTHNVTYFLESGTLLGAYREKGVIRHDKDADLGIDAAGLEYLQTHLVQVPSDYHLVVWNSSLYPDSGRDDKLPARFIHKPTALYADVFAFLDWRNATTGEDSVGPLPSVCFGGCRACPKVNGEKHFKVPREWVYPLVDCEFEGHLLKCPRESAKYLQHMYGKNYMRPS